MRRAIGFDLGETLLTYADTPPSWASLYRLALERCVQVCDLGRDETAFERAAVALARHNTRLHPRAREIGATEIFAEVLAGWGPPPPERIASAVAAFFGFFQQRLVCYPESVTALASLRANGFRLGVLTDVPYGMPRDFVQADLRAAGLEKSVDVLLTSVDTGWRKPAIPGFQQLAAALGVTTTNLWYIGNEEKDIAGAIAAGAMAVLIDRENRRPNWGQHHTIGDLRELLVRVK